MLTELTQSEIREVLGSGFIGRIGCRSEDRIYIFPVNYVVMDDMVYCQSYEGAKVEMMRRYPEVCFEVEDIRDFNHWKTVMGWGSFEELKSDDELQQARQLFSDAMLAEKASLASNPPAESAVRPSGTPTVVVYYRLRFHELTGRTERSI